jgi:hypothetical protein
MTTYDKVKAAGASATNRRVVNRISSIRGIGPKHTNSPRRDCDEALNGIEHRLNVAAQIAIEKAERNGEPFRNPYVAKDERLYRVTYHS